uniref:Uncharacterized protein n=1 Tax=Oryza meridionalis TaxID=40149 RepID=A0A0E0BY61_9ORYZ
MSQPKNQHCVFSYTTALFSLFLLFFLCSVSSSSPSLLFFFLRLVLLLSLDVNAVLPLPLSPAATTSLLAFSSCCRRRSPSTLPRQIQPQLELPLSTAGARRGDAGEGEEGGKGQEGNGGGGTAPTLPQHVATPLPSPVAAGSRWRAVVVTGSSPDLVGLPHPRGAGGRWIGCAGPVPPPMLSPGRRRHRSAGSSTTSPPLTPPHCRVPPVYSQQRGRGWKRKFVVREPCPRATRSSNV